MKWYEVYTFWTKLISKGNDYFFPNKQCLGFEVIKKYPQVQKFNFVLKEKEHWWGPILEVLQS